MHAAVYMCFQSHEASLLPPNPPPPSYSRVVFIVADVVTNLSCTSAYILEQ